VTLFVTTSLLSAATGGSGNVSVSFTSPEALTGGSGSATVALSSSEAVTGGSGSALVSVSIGEAVTGGSGQVIISVSVLEILIQVYEEEPVPTAIFPELIGLTYGVKKTPVFKTGINEASSGEEVRTAYMEWPRWEFELSYDFLPDRGPGEQDLRTLMGFFLSRRGSFEAWLFKDPDDNTATETLSGTYDGSTNLFRLFKSTDGFLEPVGAVDDGFALDVFGRGTQNHTIPAVGPYVVSVAYATKFVSNISVYNNDTATTMTKVSGAPASGQYSVVGGVYTFNSANAGDSVDIRYNWEFDEADYDLLAGNQIEFSSVPPVGTEIRASFRFFYKCRFMEDAMEFEKFMDKLWSLNTCDFKSVL
jgi:hypothetical protein